MVIFIFLGVIIIYSKVAGYPEHEQEFRINEGFLRKNR